MHTKCDPVEFSGRLDFPQKNFPKSSRPKGQEDHEHHRFFAAPTTSEMVAKGQGRLLPVPKCGCPEPSLRPSCAGSFPASVPHPPIQQALSRLFLSRPAKSVDFGSEWHEAPLSNFAQLFSQSSHTRMGITSTWNEVDDLVTKLREYT